MQPSRLDAIQFLRGSAASLVVVNHAIVTDAQLRGDVYGLVDFSGFLGRYAVEVFFVISGYIMVWTSLGRSGTPGYWKDFLVKRLTRIAPIYWLLTVVSLMKGLAAQHTYTFMYVAMSFLFVPYPDVGQDIGMSPVLGVGWSLNFEMLFYLVFAAAIGFGSHRVVLVVGAVFGALVLYGATMPPAHGIPARILGYLSDPISLFFVAGMLTAHLAAACRDAGWNRLDYRAATLTAVALSAVMSVYVYRSGDYAQIQPVQVAPAVLVVIICTALSREAGAPTHRSGFYRMSQRLGDASYSIYLSHPIVVGLFAKLLRVSPGLAIALNSLLCIGVGLAVHRYVETPMLEWIRRWTKPRPALTPTAA